MRRITPPGSAPHPRAPAALPSTQAKYAHWRQAAHWSWAAPLICACRPLPPHARRSAAKYAHWLNLTAELGVRAVELVRWEDMLDPGQQARGQGVVCQAGRVQRWPMGDVMPCVQGVGPVRWEDMLDPRAAGEGQLACPLHVARAVRHPLMPWQRGSVRLEEPVRCCAPGERAGRWQPPIACPEPPTTSPGRQHGMPPSKRRCASCTTMSC